MSCRIMVVDDAAFMRMTIISMLSKYDFEIVGEAKNGAEAVTMYETVKPDIVTLDITMPEVDGLSAARAILARDPNAKIIMVSAMGQQALVMDAINAGAKDFIVKPFQEDRIIASINRVISR